MSVTLPDCANPELSVVMVTHGRWPLTQRSISALVANTPPCFELIVVDNASKDETRGEIAKLAGARLIRNERNVGFGPAANQGAEQARAEYLLLLNTDAFVHPKWLEPLLETIARPGVGATVPRYLHLDGSLQEAGALLARDGTVHVYGDGDDPNKPCYRFRRDIDFGGAACMLMRRRTFHEFDGFDDVFAPAYYEDADLCMRIARRGLSVSYEPRSTVIHVRYGSGGLENAEQLSERNRRVFAERWGEHLAPRPATFAHASGQAVIAARDALATPRILNCVQPHEPGCTQLAKAMIDRWPRARLTWLIDEPRGGGVDFDAWLALGVEVLDLGEVSQLEQRLFHYDLIVGGSRCDAAAQAIVARTQPQAYRISASELRSQAGPALSRPAPALSSAGIA